MKILRTGAALAAVAALALTACGGDNGNGGDTTSTSDGSPSAASTLSGTLQGTGASSMKNAQDAWRAAFQTANPDVTINYSPEGSGAGRTAFIDGAAAFAGSDAALKDDELAGSFAMCVEGTDPINLPVYISPIAIIYNVDGVDQLNLSAEVVAKIFAEEITNWNDPAIAELNEGVTFPDLAITPVHRSDKSGTTENFTDTLNSVAPEVWTNEGNQEWPAELGGEGADKTTGVVTAVQNGAGAIGYADESGVPQGMTVAMYSADGKADLVGPTAEDAAAIVDASKRVEGRADHDYSLELDRTASGYPFVLVAYAIVCQEYQDAATGELVNAYISYVTSDQGQQDAVPEAGNAPLSGELAKGVQEAAAAIK